MDKLAKAVYARDLRVAVTTTLAGVLVDPATADEYVKAEYEANVALLFPDSE